MEIPINENRAEQITVSNVAPCWLEAVGHAVRLGMMRTCMKDMTVSVRTAEGQCGRQDTTDSMLVIEFDFLARDRTVGAMSTVLKGIVNRPREKADGCAAKATDAYAVANLQYIRGLVEAIAGAAGSDAKIAFQYVNPLARVFRRYIADGDSVIRQELRDGFPVEGFKTVAEFNARLLESFVNSNETTVLEGVDLSAFPDGSQEAFTDATFDEGWEGMAKLD